MENSNQLFRYLEHLEVREDCRVRETVLPQSRCELERELLHGGGEEKVRHVHDGGNNERRKWKQTQEPAKEFERRCARTRVG